MAFSSTLDAALQYADRGWPVFPCKPDKKPHTAHGFKDASTDHATIMQWWRQWPEAQVAVACGPAGICVIDLDLGKGKDGIAAFSRLKDENGPDWCEVVASTPRGGRHYVYLMPEHPVSCSTDIIPGSGIDVRADGGYVVVPSPASPGREWSIGNPFDTDLTQMPEWVESLARGGRQPTTARSDSLGGTSSVAMVLDAAQVAAIKRALAHIDSDNRTTWLRVGMALKSTSAREQSYDLWEEWAATSPRYSGFDLHKHRRQWDSIREFRMDGSEVTIATLFHMAKERGYVPTVAEEVMVESLPPAAPAPVPTVKRPFPVELMNCPGLIGEIAKWMVASSRRQQKAMCLASAIITVGAVIGRRVTTETDLRSNIYALGIGETACGKDPSVKLPHLLLTRAGLGWAVGPGEWKSDSGLRAALMEAPSHAAYVDEFTKLLDQMSGVHVGGHVKGIKKHLLEMWSASNSVHAGAAYANRELNPTITIQQPNLCLYGVGVPSELFSSLDRGALTDGFLNRMLIFFADEQQPAIQRIGRAEPPEDLVAKVADLDRATRIDGIDNAMTVPKVRTVAFDDAAREFIDDLERENDKRITTMRAAGDPLSDLWVRFGAHTAKLALVRCVSEDPTRDISLADATWARDLVVWCLERTMAEAEARVSDNHVEAQTKRVLRLVVAAGEKGVTSHTLTRATQWLRKGDRKDALGTLIESGQVVCEERPQPSGPGRPSTVYVATQFRAAPVIPSTDGIGLQ